MKESAYQANIIRQLKARFEGCVVLKNDSSYQQGIPDLLVLHKDKWAMLEVKPSADSPRQPNQDYWVEQLGQMSYSSFLSPENEDEVLRDLDRIFLKRPRRATVRTNY